jgi:hypothetical protein
LYGGDAWDFSRAGDNIDDFGSLYGIKRLLELKGSGKLACVLGNRDLNKLFIPFSLMTSCPPAQYASYTGPNIRYWPAPEKVVPVNFTSPILWKDLNTILEDTQGVNMRNKGGFQGFDNYCGKMPEIRGEGAGKVNESNAPKMLKNILEHYRVDKSELTTDAPAAGRLTPEYKNNQAVLFLCHLMCPSGVMYQWLDLCKICHHFQYARKDVVFSHGCLPECSIDKINKLKDAGWTRFTELLEADVEECNAHDNAVKFLKDLKKEFDTNTPLTSIDEFGKIESNDDKTLRYLINLSVPGLQFHSPVNDSMMPADTPTDKEASCQKIKDNISKFLEHNPEMSDLVVMHGHVNYQNIDAPLKYDFTRSGKSAMVVYADTSAWRKESDDPSCITFEGDKIYVHSPYMSKSKQLTEYKTEITSQITSTGNNELTFTLNNNRSNIIKRNIGKFPTPFQTPTYLGTEPHIEGFDDAASGYMTPRR